MDKTTNSTTTRKSGSEDFSTLFNLSDFGRKKVDVHFNAEQSSHDGGLLLLREIDKQTGLLQRLAGCIDDTRNASYVRHKTSSILSQRVYQIAAGYEDANDCNAMRHDGVLKFCTESQQALCSQPTMSRFENSVSNKQLYLMAKAFIDHFICSYDCPPAKIILDCDDTCANTYGQQQLNLYNHYYREYCYMPLHIYEGLSGKLITTILKPGRRSKSVNVFALLKRIVLYLARHWPNTIIMLRGDSHFCSKEFMDWSEGHDKVDFLTGLTGNQKLHAEIKSVREAAEKLYAEKENPVKCYHSFTYKAAKWEQPQRVIAKIEVSSMGTNIRYIITSFRNIEAKALYEKGYCARANAELRIKDHKTYLASDRMSCNSFKANQLRLFLHSAAYVLLHDLRQQVLTGTQYAKATMKTLQLKLIKIAARVKMLKTKIVIELPVAFAVRPLFEKCFALLRVIRT